MGYSRGGRRKTLSCSEHGSPLSTAASSAKQVQPCHGCLPPSLPQTRQWEPRAPQAQKSRDGTRLTQTSACCRCCSLYVPQRGKSQQPGCETPGAQPPNCLGLDTFRRKSWSAPRAPALPLAGWTVAIRDQGWQNQIDAWSQTACPPSKIPSGLKDNRSSVQQRYEELLFITMTIVISTYVLINTNTMKMTIPPSVVIPRNNSFGKYAFLYTRSYLYPIKIRKGSTALLLVAALLVSPGWCWRHSQETLNADGPKLFCGAGGVIKGTEIPVLMSSSILYIACGAAQQQRCHISLRAT